MRTARAARVGIVCSTLLVIALGACSSDDDAPPQQLDAAGATDAPGPVDGALADAATSPDVHADATANDDSATGPSFSGEATYYDADGTGACGYKASPNDLMVAALNGDQYKKSWCGQCVLVTGPKGTTVKVRIVDLCPGCSQGDLDLGQEAFQVLSPISAGRIKISWHVVSC